MDTGIHTTDPASEESSNQTQQIAEDGNGFGDNPRDDPAGQANCHPGPNGDKTILMQACRSTEDAHVYILACDMTEDDTSDDNLLRSKDPALEGGVGWMDGKRTVGIARP